MKTRKQTNKRLFGLRYVSGEDFLKPSFRQKKIDYVRLAETSKEVKKIYEKEEKLRSIYAVYKRTTNCYRY